VKENTEVIFLMNYDRVSGCLIELRTFLDVDRERANHERIELEISLSRAGIRREVVLLEASDEDALRKTHRRYFENLNQLST
jgi:hypothetical protein